MTANYAKLNDYLLSHFQEMNIGLDGCTGAYLKLRIMEKLAGSELFQAIKPLLLERISNEIGYHESLDFGGGLAGIGWAIEIMSQYDLLTSDTNEILEDLDDVLYKTVTFSASHELSVSKGVLGNCLYFGSRKRTFADVHLYKSILNDESLNALILDIAGKTSGTRGILTAYARQDHTDLKENDLIDIASSLYILSCNPYYKAYPIITQKVIYDGISFIDSYLKERISIRKMDQGVLLFVSNCYLAIADNLDNSKWRKSGRQYVNGFKREDLSATAPSLWFANVILENNHLEPVMPGIYTAQSPILDRVYYEAVLNNYSDAQELRDLIEVLAVAEINVE